MNIAFDLDGVLYPWHRAVYNELLVYWELGLDFQLFWSEGYKNYKNDMFWYNIVRLEHLYSNQVADLQDVKFLKELAKKHSIYYITNRPVEVKLATINWLRRNEFPHTNNLIFTDDKVKVADSIGIQIFIEDRIENAEKLKNICKVFVVRQPYNAELLNGYTVINSVHELRGVI